MAQCAEQIKLSTWYSVYLVYLCSVVNVVSVPRVLLNPSYASYNRGVARIFSEVRTILQNTLHPPPPPPRKKKTFLDLRFGYVVSVTVFFCI